MGNFGQTMLDGHSGVQGFGKQVLGLLLESRLISGAGDSLHSDSRQG